MPSPKLKQLVRRGYNLASKAYRDDQGRGAYDTLPYAAWARELTKRLKPGAAVLDLGCGNGLPMTRLLARRFAVLGVDLSDVQVRRARVLVPGARFRRADMARLRLPLASLDAVACLYALIHVPRREQRVVLRRMAGWLKPGGLLLLIVGMNAGQGREKDWLGVKGAAMYWAQEDLATYEGWFKRLGLKILKQRRIPEGTAAHQLYLLRKAGPKREPRS